MKSVAEHFSTGLAKQGWKSGVELITPNSAILNLTRGDASLTVMIKPADGGSKTTIFAKGLEWGG